MAQAAKLVRARRSGRASSWAILVGLFGVALALRLALGPAFDNAPFAPFVPILPLAALLCGWRKAFLVLGAAVAANAVIAAGRGDGPPLMPTFATRGGVFVLLGVFLIALVEALAQVMQRLDAAAQMNAELFRELQHRVSNNFQIVAATLAKARRNVADANALDALDQASQRIDSLGRLHRRLYDPAAYDQGLEPILRELLDDAFRNIAVDLQMDLASENLTMAQMTTILLLVNEAAINAAKHVFTTKRGKRFAVSLRGDSSQKILTVSDDGPGLPPAEAGRSQRYGLSVMRGLAAQLGGTLEMPEGAGATIRVAFR